MSFVIDCLVRHCFHRFSRRPLSEDAAPAEDYLLLPSDELRCTSGDTLGDLSLRARDEYAAAYCPRSRALSDASALDGGALRLPRLAQDEVVLPGSELQAAMAVHMARKVGGGEGEGEDECVICLEPFDEDNPRMPTRCGCGEDRTYFHLPCLYEWVEKCQECPTCREKLHWREFE